jgi:23S rRNA G2069 N7-methylase RlmK/C1962 C5-methylase RlmI
VSNKISLLKLIETATEQRKLLSNKYTNYRIFDGVADGIADLYIDKFASLIVIHYLNPNNKKFIEDLKAIKTELVKLFSAETIYLNLHAADPKISHQADLLYGAATPTYQIAELGIKLILKPEQNRNAGLFLDTRDLKEYLIKNSANKKVLNTFCFTGVLGLASMLGGAREVVQVDISRSILNWAKENYELNLNSKNQNCKMRFVEEHTLKFMQRELRRLQERKIEPYQIIILDPPSFGNTKGAKFVIEKDLPELIDVALQLIELKNGNFLSITCNHQQLSLDKLKDMITGIARERKVKISKLISINAPEADFKSSKIDFRAVKGWKVLF